MRRFHPFVKRPVPKAIILDDPHESTTPEQREATLAAFRDGLSARLGTTPSPLSPDALSVLVRAEKNGPVIRQTINPGISTKLVNEGWCTLVDIPNPRRVRDRLHGAQMVQALAITEKGKARIAFDEP